KPVAWHGADAEYIHLMPLGLVDTEAQGRGLAARAVRERTAITVDDMAQDPRILLRKEALERGFRSLIMLPLMIAEEPVGVLALYAGEVGFFDEEEMKLLRELAGDIAFALEHMQKEERLRRLTRVNAMLSGINGVIARVRDRRELFQEACRIAVDTGGLRFAWLNIVDEKEERVERLTRVHAVLSGINAAIVRIRDQQELFHEACRIAIEHGKFRMAWVGLVDRAAGLVKPVASAGEVGDFFESAPLAVIENKPGGHGLAGRAVRDMKPMISNDVTNDPQRLMRKELDERGIKSLAIIPLMVGGEAIGVLALYAAETGTFD